MVTAAVLTGIGTRVEFEAQAAPPHLVVDDLAELLQHYRRLG